MDEHPPYASGVEGPGGPPDFRRVFEAAPGAMMLLSSDLRILAVSDRFLTVSMTRRDDITGRPLFDVFPDNPGDPTADGARNLRASLDHVLRHGVPDVMAVQRYDVERPAAQGGGFEERWWSPVNAPILNEDGEVDYILQRVEDVTALVEEQRERGGAQAPEGSLDRLRVEVLARSREVAEVSRRLKEANEELERLAEAERETQRLKDEFLATVSHELRTPLTSVIGYLHLVLQGGYALDPEVRGHLEVSERNGERLLALVEELLMIAQYRTGHLRPSRRPVDVTALVNEALAAARPAADAGGLRVECEVAATEPLACDPGRIRQMLDNLISNALKFTPRGGTVWVRLEPRDDGVRVSVTDTGPGIPPDEQERLFDRFYRASGASREGVPGTGLGLAIARAIAEAHGGMITLRSREGYGSTFLVDLPREAAQV
jgi:signal transduction histidine kinase